MCDCLLPDGCRACAGGLDSLVCFGPQPLANQLIGPEDPPAKLHRLHMLRCRQCGAGQLAEPADPDDMFHQGYLYRTAANRSRHWRRLADDVMHTLHPRRVVDVGSNDGTLLSLYPDGVETLGVDPAGTGDIPCIKAPLTEDLAGQIGPVDVVHASNVVAHVPDIGPFLRALAMLAGDSGTVIVETPDLNMLPGHDGWDCVYHEHVWWWGPQSLASALRQAELTVVGTVDLDVHGGSVRLYCRRTGTPAGLPDSVDADTLARSYGRYQGQLDRWRHILDSDLRVGVFGAAAKTTMRMHQIGDPARNARYVLDSTEQKWGRRLPGTGIPVRPESWLDGTPVDRLLVGAWNWRTLIVQRLGGWMQAGGILDFPDGPVTR